jgi:hypothetical protein
MEREDIYNCEIVNQISIIDFLERLGYKPQRTKGKSYWYCSPLREEKEASFKVDTGRNQWFDFGLWKGGSLVDLGIAYYECPVSDFLTMIKEDNLLRLQVKSKAIDYHLADVDERKLKILSTRKLSSYALYDYLNFRAIQLSIAKQYCQQVNYKIEDKNYFAIGFKNDSGGYELRNKIIKLSSSPKDITTILNGNKKVSVFEGFFNFMSYLVLFGEDAINETDFIILNTLAFFRKSLQLTNSYEEVNLFLDNDVSGQNCTAEMLEAGLKYIDKSSLYQDHNDLNDYLRFEKNRA